MYDEIKTFGLHLETTEKATETNISEFENKLGIKLGKEYKSFLLEFGTLEVEYLEFYGYFKDDSSLPSAINSTLYHRESIENFPNDLIVFFESGDGSFFCVDRDDEVYKCTYNRCTKVEKKFKDFLIERIRGVK